MTVQEFLQNYGGNECVSIEGYCEEKHYDYYILFGFRYGRRNQLLHLQMVRRKRQ